MVMETVKKIPAYNTNMTVELAFQCAWMKSLMPDPRIDEGDLLEEDVEPAKPVSDNCMREGIDVQPQPMVNMLCIENLGSDIKNHFKTLEARSTKSKLSKTSKKLSNKITGNGKRGSPTRKNSKMSMTSGTGTGL